jgi:hypothetical protein
VINDEVADAFAWTVDRLLALSGEPGEADQLTTQVLHPPAKWCPPWLMAGHKARQAHVLDPRPIGRRKRF